MPFTPEQIASLEAKLDGRHVKSRKQAGRSLDYIEGWHAETEANRIFGHGNWDLETVYERCVMERERKIGTAPNQRDGWGVSYICKVRLTVHAGDDKTIREGVGAGHGIDADLGLAHESAVKEAATDAEKRAFKTFGNPFGLALYDKAQENVEREAPAPRQQRQAPAPSNDRAAQADTTTVEVLKLGIDTCEDADALRAFWQEHWPHIRNLPGPLHDEVVAHKDARKDALTKKEAA